MVLYRSFKFNFVLNVFMRKVACVVTFTSVKGCIYSKSFVHFLHQLSWRFFGAALYPSPFTCQDVRISMLLYVCLIVCL